MLDNMSSVQLFDWLEYYNSEPWGNEIDNYRSGIIASSIMNSVRSARKDKVWTPNDFFNFEGSNRVGQTSDQHYNTMKLIASAQNSKKQK